MPILLTLAATARAATLTVCASGCDAPDLATAVAAAAHGDTIEVGPGTWTDRVQVTRDLTVVATDPDVTFLDPLGGTSFTVDDGARFTLQDFRVAGAVGHLVVVYRTSNAVVEGLVVEQHASELEDGTPHAPFEASSGASLTIRDSTFSDLVGPSGYGLIHALDADIVLERVTVDGSVADGGAVRVDGGSLTVTDSAFSGCDGYWFAGVIYADRAVIEGSVFTANTTLAYGAHIDVWDLELRDSTVTDGYCDNFGGVTIATRGTIERTTFSRNVARNGSGALNCGGDCTILDSVFENNDGGQGHGGAAELDEGAVIERCAFRYNGADAPGGALSLRYPDVQEVRIVDSTFLGNESYSDAGAVFVSGSGEVLVTGSSFEANRGGSDAGAIMLEGVSAALIEDSTFTQNWAGYGSGAIKSVGPLTVRRSVLCGNNTPEYQGGAITSTGALTVRASVFAGNRAPRGGAILAEGESLSVVNSDFLWNDAPEGAAILVTTTTADLRNLLFVANEGGPVVGLEGETAATTGWNASWQDTEGPSGLDLGTTVTTDPLLAGAAGAPCDSFDARRLAGSPLLDVGDPDVLDRDGTRSDIGAYGGPDTWPDDDGDGSLSVHDCDDADPLAFPGADERCNGADDDCDGVVDEDAVDVTAWTPDRDGDGYGAGAAVVGCEGADGDVAQGGDCDDDDAGRNPGLDEIANDGVDQDCDDEDLVMWLTGRTCTTGPAAGAPLWALAALLLRRRRARAR